MYRKLQICHIQTYQQRWHGHGKGAASSGIAGISDTDAPHMETGSP